MHLDVVDLKNFYFRTKLGWITQRLLQESLERIWGTSDRGQLVGFGFAVPMLAPFTKNCLNWSCLMPAQQGVIHWPNERENKSLLVEETSWPFESNSVDSLLVAHGLETCENPNLLLQEIWRVLSPSGRVIFVVPNRSGLWVRSDVTPFGYGRPYSLRQLEKQLLENRLQLDSHLAALFGPPSERAYWLKTMGFCEKVGRSVDLRMLAGALIVQAGKQNYLKPNAAVRDSLIDPMGVLQGLTKPKPKPISRKI